MINTNGFIILQTTEKKLAYFAQYIRTTKLQNESDIPWKELYLMARYRNFFNITSQGETGRLIIFGERGLKVSPNGFKKISVGILKSDECKKAGGERVRLRPHR